MTVHVLDTGAVYVLLTKHRPALLTMLEEAADRADQDGTPRAIWIPAAVMVEVEQTSPAPQKRLEALLKLAEVMPMDERLAQRAAEGLRSVTRDKCKECSALGRPTIVDAVVMAFAAEYAEKDPDTFVHTQDVGDMEKLRDGLFKKVQVRRA